MLTTEIQYKREFSEKNRVFRKNYYFEYLFSGAIKNLKIPELRRSFSLLKKYHINVESNFQI